MLTRPSPGFGFIELFVALFIASFATVALFKWQWLNVQQHQQIIWRAIALNQANQLAEQFSLHYPVDPTFLLTWRQETQRQLPAGKATFNQQQGAYHIVITWQCSIEFTPCRYERSMSE